MVRGPRAFGQELAGLVQIRGGSWLMELRVCRDELLAQDLAIIYNFFPNNTDLEKDQLQKT